MAARSEIIGEQPSTSMEQENIVEEDKYTFMNVEQQDITDGLHVCYKILEKLQIVKGSVNKSVSIKASALRERFAKVIIATLKEYNFNEEGEELFLLQEDIPGEDIKQAYDSLSLEKISASTSTLQSTDDSGDEFKLILQEIKIRLYIA